MPGRLTPQEREIFVLVYRLFEAYNDPPPNRKPEASAWWANVVSSAGNLSSAWQNHKLMDVLLSAILEYLEYKSKEKTKELEEFEF